MFEENSTGHFDAKIYSNISQKFALKKVCLNIFCSIKVSLDPRIHGCNGKIY